VLPPVAGSKSVMLSQSMWSLEEIMSLLIMRYTRNPVNWTSAATILIFAVHLHHPALESIPHKSSIFDDDEFYSLLGL